jgi:hypothetical protein
VTGVYHYSREGNLIVLCKRRGLLKPVLSARDAIRIKSQLPDGRVTEGGVVYVRLRGRVDDDPTTTRSEPRSFFVGALLEARPPGGRDCE